MNNLKLPYWPDEPNSKPLPKQLAGHKVDYRFRMLSGAVRAGKSVWGCQEGIKLSFKWNGNTGAILRNTLTELKRTTQVTFFKIFGCTSDDIETHPLVKSWNKTEQHLTFINGSDIYFIGCDNLRVLKSLDCGWIFVDEGTEVKSSILRFSRTRISKKLNYPDFNQYFFTATNPGDEQHILYEWFIKIPETELEKKEREKFWCIFTTSYDNEYLTDDYKDEIDSWKSDKEFHDRYALGKWGRFKGLVYGEFDEQIHLVKEPDYKSFMDRIVEYYSGNDWGYTNPAAILYIGLTGDKDIILFDEIYVTEKTNPELRDLHFNKQDKHEMKIRQMYSDPSEPSDIKEFQNNGIPATKGNNDIEAGIRKVKEFLRLQKNKKPKFYIFERCVHTRKEFRLYRRPVDDEISEKKNVPELPIDKDNHALGALRYFAMTHFLGPGVLQYDGKRGESGTTDLKHLSPIESYRRARERKQQEKKKNENT
jgi:phage terminase large subunit